MLGLGATIVSLSLRNISDLLFVGLLLPQERRKPLHIIISHPVILPHPDRARC
jgi:hypothetical protein